MIQSHITRFALTAKNSPEDQSHGWGCAWLSNGKWAIYRSIAPVWEDSMSLVAQSTCLIAHARSAYRNEGIVLCNNMPFYDGSRVFVFNGELQGVRVRVDGRIGAEKVFNFIKRFDDGEMRRSIETAVETLHSKSRYVRAMNLMIAESDSVFLSTSFNENPDYFQMHEKIDNGTVIVSSSPYENESGWTPIANRTTKAI